VTTPRRSATLLVAMATRVLPSGPVRERYRKELTSELHDLETAGQLRHAIGFLASAWSLRRAVIGADPLLGGVVKAFPSPLHCRLRLYHHYRLNSTEDGHRYLRCRSCGKDYPGTGNGPVDQGMAGVIVTSSGIR
jgi:hypothetical protein